MCLLARILSLRREFLYFQAENFRPTANLRAVSRFICRTSIRRIYFSDAGFPMHFPSSHTQGRVAGFCGRILVSLAITGIWLAPAVHGQTKSDEKTEEKGFTLIEEGTRPLATVTFASADRFVEEARYIFDAAGTPDAFKVVEDWLSGSLNDLEGFNREKPFGVMV